LHIGPSMDGSHHPNATEATDNAHAGPHEGQSLAVDPELQDQSRENHQGGTKRPLEHEDDAGDHGEKRQHVYSDEEEDLDLDALMAHLQHHAEQGQSHDSQSDAHKDASKDSPVTSETVQEQEDAAPTETELSIAAQLRGALSSFQDLEGEGISLDELSQMLRPAEGDKEKSSEREPEKADDTRENEKKPENKRSDLISQMPPPPAHMRALPPMPPPPPAFTSPVASYNAIELAKNRDQPLLEAGTSVGVSSSQTGADAASGAKSLELASKFPEPQFSEVTPVSESYGSTLADQIDGIFKESRVTEVPTESSSEKEKQNKDAVESTSAGKVVLHLNENRAIREARRRSILLLDSLACQVLDTLSSNHYQDTLSTVMQPESDRGMAYRILLDTFEDLKRIYLKWETQSSREHAEPKLEEVRPFLSYEIPGIEQSRDNLITIQRVNLATFIAAVFGSIEIGFYELNDWFVKVFVPENGRLLKQQCNIYLDLKTQAYISALESTDDSEIQIVALDHLFPENLEARMQEMLGDRVSLSPTEKDFVAKCHRRKDNIKSEDPKTLPMKYHWVPFLRDVSEYISRNHYSLLPQRRHSIVPTEVDVHPPVAATTTVRHYPQTRRQAPAPRASIPEPDSTRNKSAEPTDDPDVEVSSVKPAVQRQSDTTKTEVTDVIDKDASRSSTRDVPSPASNGTGSTNNTPDDVSRSDAPNDNRNTDKPHRPDIPVEGHPLFPPLPKQVLPRPLSEGASFAGETERARKPGPRPPPPADTANHDTGNTLAAYEAARASAEGTDLIRPKTSLYTTRRTWTKEEEEALLKGMDRVQGPYWAQILELYGPAGKINEVLKDRTQVQLKDKARNLKMFFVRLGLPIPAVFQYVTGDYETRKSSSKRVREKKQNRLDNQPGIVQHGVGQPGSPASAPVPQPISQPIQEHRPLSHQNPQPLTHTEERVSSEPGSTVPQSSTSPSQTSYPEPSEASKTSEAGEGIEQTQDEDKDKDDEDDISSLLDRVGEYVDGK